MIYFLLVYQEESSKYRTILTSDNLRSRKTACTLFFSHICSVTKEAKLILICKQENLIWKPLETMCVTLITYF